jgi:hypothetical protein
MPRQGVGVMKKLEDVDRALQALKAGEVDQAATQFDRLTALAHERGKRVGGMPAAAWDLLLRLLEKRGFFVSTPEALSKSLDEIHELGQGFDLRTLMVAMACYDMTVAGVEEQPEVLWKPLDPEALYEKVCRLLDLAGRK